MKKLSAACGLLIAFGVVCGQQSTAADDLSHSSKGTTMYADDLALLKKHTSVVELSDGHGAHVAVCPAYQGRVMTSTCDGKDGASLGWVNRAFIEKGESNPHFNNYGGEERIWLSPEGGPYSLWFKPGAKQELANWYTPPALNEGEFTEPPQKPTLPADRRSSILLERRMQLTNTAGTQFDLAVSRAIRLLDAAELGQAFGAEAKSAVDAGKLKIVGYESENTLTNRGPAMTEKGGLVSIWILGMFVAGPETTIVVPYRAGSEKELGPIVKSDYFGSVPAERLRITPDHILFTGDSHYRSKIGVSQRRVKPIAGSIDPVSGVLTLVSFDMPTDPTSKPYMNNAWGAQEHSYVGDVFNSYNDGPPGKDQPQLGAFYEIESLSPTAELKTGQRLTHRQRTFHIQGDKAAIVAVAKAALGYSE